jgi:hypothetical protein
MSPDLINRLPQMVGQSRRACPAKRMSAKRRKEIAQKAAQARWKAD